MPVTFNTIFKKSLTSPVLTVQDLSGITGNYSAILKVEDAQGVIYNNTDYSNPDLTNSITSKDVTLRLDINDKPIKGSYKVTVSYRINYSNSITAVNTSLKRFTIVGGTTEKTLIENSYITDSEGEVIPDVRINISGSTGNNGNYKPNIIAVNFTNLFVIVKETISSSVADGNINYYAYGSQVKTYDYEFTDPTLVVAVTPDSVAMQLFIEDKSVYTNTLYTNTALVRTGTVKYPDTITINKPSDITFSSSTMTVYPPLYNGIWTVVLSVALTYKNKSDNHYVETVVGTTYEYTFSNDECLCQIDSCLAELLARKESAIISGSSELVTMQKYIDQIEENYTAYLSAAKCGNTEKMSTAMANMRAIATEAPCKCCEDTSSNANTKLYPTYSNTSHCDCPTGAYNAGLDINNPQCLGNTVSKIMQDTGTKVIKDNILTTSSQILAQANQQPLTILQLLQG